MRSQKARRVPLGRRKVSVKIVKVYFDKELTGCIVWNAHNTVVVSKRSVICAQAVHFLHSTRPSVT